MNEMEKADYAGRCRGRERIPQKGCKKQQQKAIKMEAAWGHMHTHTDIHAMLYEIVIINSCQQSH